jgi:hypothetical protein
MLKSRFVLFCIMTFSMTAFPLQRDVQVTFNPQTGGPQLKPDLMNGTCLPIWNSKDVYKGIRGGLQKGRYSLFRFPNGSLSNDYHWNGSGSYSSDGTWTCDSTAWKGGFMSIIKHRGTSKYHYGFEGPSAITDGDTATQWWSDPLIKKSLPYFYLEFPGTATIDSVVIMWGNRYGKDFLVQRWNTPGTFYPGPYQTAADRWVTIDSVIGSSVTVYATKLAESATAPYFRVLVQKWAGDSGVQVKEMYLYNKGTQVTKNEKKYTDKAGQTKAVALPTHGGSAVRADWATGWVNWDFETFLAYCDSFPYQVEPVICVNFGTGTPEEAAAWVHYANVVKKRGIRFWQVGNEMDGSWEEGGPVSAAIYAEKFLLFSKAMKAVDPSIKVFGPVLSTADFDGLASGTFNDSSWMATILSVVGAQEKQDKAIWLDGVDFHSYPYYFSGSPLAATMLEKSDYIWTKADTLLGMMRASLPNADSVLVFMSEYNSSVVMASMLQEPINGVCLANMYASLAQKFAGRAMAVVWDSYEGMAAGPGGTWGSLSLFSEPSGKAAGTASYQPAAIYWPLFMAGTQWLEPAPGLSLCAAQYDRKSGVRAFGAAGDKEFRALFLNMSTDTVRLACTLSGASYAQVDCYTWGSREFRWQGTGAGAFATPNCGPSSRRVAADSLKAIPLLPLTCSVVAWHDSAAGCGSPALLQAAHSTERLRAGDTLRFWGTVADSACPVSIITVQIDSIAARPLVPLDGAADGLCESWSGSIASSELAPGSHRVIVAAANSAGRKVGDTFTVMASDSLRPVTLIDNFEDRDLVCLLPSGATWTKYHCGTPASSLTLAIDSSGGSGSAGALRASFSLAQPPTLGYTVYGSLYLNLDTVFMDTARPRIRGITFKYATTHSNSAGSFVLQAQSNPVTDYNYFRLALDNTAGAWKRVFVEWRDFSQEAWGITIDSLATRQIKRLEFRMQNEGAGSLVIDDLAFVSDSGAPVQPVIRRKTAVPPAWLSIMQRPNSGVLFSLGSANAQISSLKIFNARGIQVHSSGALRPGRSWYLWKPGARGVYFVRLTGRNAVLERKFCVLR